MRRIEGIDITRGLLALSVAIYHYVQFLGVDWLKQFHPIINAGLTSVDGFFMISGFALFYSYQHMDFTDHKNTLRYFYKRFARIAPLFYLCMLIDTLPALPAVSILLVIFVFGIIGKKKAIIDGVLFSCLACMLLLMLLKPLSSTYDRLLLVNNISFLFGFLNPNLTSVRGGWSIGIEFIFYFALPFMLSFGKRNIKIMIGITLTSYILALNYQLLNHMDLYSYDSQAHAKELVANWPIYTNPLNHMHFFMSGMVLFLIYDRYYVVLNEKKSLLIGASILLLCLYCVLDRVTGNPSHGVGRIVYSLLTIAMISLTPFMTIKDSWLKKKLMTLGDISYSLYLMQFPVYTIVIYFIKSTTLPTSIQLILILACLLIVSYLTHHLYEMPTKRWLTTLRSHTNKILMDAV